MYLKSVSYISPADRGRKGKVDSLVAHTVIPTFIETISSDIADFKVRPILGLYPQDYIGIRDLHINMINRE